MPVKQRIDCIDGWRAIAALGVLYAHLLSVLNQPALLIGHVNVFKFFVILGSGVQLFFVISGFCFFLVLNDKKDLSFSSALHFWKKRWLRIAPAFYMACIVYGFIRFGHVTPAFIYSLLANFVFFQTYIPGTEIAALFWSLSVEWIFYLLLPGLFIVIKRYGYRIGIYGLIIAGLLLNLIHYRGYFYKGDTVWYYTIFANLAHFGWGMLLGYVYKKWTIHVSAVKGSILFIAGLVVAYAGRIFFYTEFLRHTHAASFLFEAAGPVIMTAGFSMMIFATLTTTWLDRFFSTRIMVFLGRISYSFYLWHLVILETCYYFLKPVLKENATGVLILGMVTLLIVIPVSYISYRLLESFYFKRTTAKAIL